VHFRLLREVKHVPCISIVRANPNEGVHSCTDGTKIGRSVRMSRQTCQTVANPYPI